MTSTLFTPPKTKSNDVRKQCICNWGDKCCEFNTFFNNRNHHLGDFVYLRYSDSCDFQNAWRAICHLFQVPKSTRDEFKRRYDNWKLDPTSHDKPKRILIAKFHYPEPFVTREKPSYTVPLSWEEIAALTCYEDRHQNDGVIMYDPTLGKGISKQRQNKASGKKLFRVAPCASLKQVTALAASLQQVIPSPRNITIEKREAVIAAAEERRHTEEAEVEAEAERTRTPVEWNGIVSSKCDEISNLQAEKAELLRQIELKDQRIKVMKRQSNKHQMRSIRVQSSLDEECEEEYKEIGSTATISQIKSLLSRAGGLSRLTLFNDDWHKNHPNAAKKLWGYENWDETKLYVDAYFEGEVDVTDDPSQSIKVSPSGTIQLPDLSPFEKCMICRMFFHSFTDQQSIALCFDRHRTRIGQIVKEWGPKWGNIGKYLGIMDITDDYLFKEMPDSHMLGGGELQVYADGKDWLIAPKQNNTAIAKSTYSSKTDKDAGRGITFSTSTGFVFEFSNVFASRAGEKKIVQHMSSLGPVNAKTEEWEDIAIKDPWNPSQDDTFWTALDDVLTTTEFDDILRQIDEGCPFVTNGLHDDGILLTGTASALEKDGINGEAESDSDNEDQQDDRQDEAGQEAAVTSNKRGRTLFGNRHAFDAYDLWVNNAKVYKHQKQSNQSKKPPIVTNEFLKQLNEKAIRNDPNQSGKHKLRQLEIHQRLHEMYETGQLRRNLLSYFLLVEERNRIKLLKWMGSDLVKKDGTPKPTHDSLPHVPLRLAKIPEHVSVGLDKGFVGVKWILSNMNDEETPVMIKNSKTERLSGEQILSEVMLTIRRSGTETVFRRTDTEAVMKEKIPYWLLSILPYGHALAHGEANLYQPLRYPGRNAIVGQDYWDGAVPYERIHQPTRPQSNVEVSATRTCYRCKQGGIVLMCGKCHNFYHISEACHNRVTCTDALNPYKRRKT